MKNPRIDDIKNMSSEELAQLNSYFAKRIAIQVMATVWLRITVPAVAQVCLKHAAIRAAKNL